VGGHRSGPQRVSGPTAGAADWSSATRQQRPPTSLIGVRTTPRSGAPSAEPVYVPRVRILFVCTGNLCRSPVAERLAAAWVGQSLAGSPELADVALSSAGTRATEGQEMAPASASALRQLGGVPEGFRSSALTPELANSADLIITMTRQHRREVLRMTPRGLRRTFTLIEAADLLVRADLRGLPTMPLTARACELGLRLDAARAHRPSSDRDDVVDPMGRRPAVHTETAGTIATALRPLADVLFASVRTEPITRLSA
jgi:protein-tyrosine phosphatase